MNSMYTSVNVETFKRRTGLPHEYTVDGLLASGTWDLYGKTRHLPYLVAALKTLGVDTEVRQLQGEELGHGYEFIVDSKRYWFTPVMGTAVMSQYAHLASMLGSKKNLLMGVVGGLKPGIQAADFIIPTASRGNENALMYQRTQADLLFYPDAELSASLKRRLGGTTVYEGVTNTCEVMFAETAEDVQAWSKAGYLGVEMEAAMLFALSNYFQVPSAALLYVADNLIEDITMFSDAHQTSKAARDTASRIKYEVAVAELLNLPLP